MGERGVFLIVCYQEGCVFVIHEMKIMASFAIAVNADLIIACFVQKRNA